METVDIDHARIVAMTNDNAGDRQYDSLDDFLEAASSNRYDDMEAAARNITGEPAAEGRDSGLGGMEESFADADFDLFEPPREREPAGAPKSRTRHSPEDGRDKFIPLDPVTISGMEVDPEKPFILIPANIHSFIPIWGWVAIGFGLAVMIVGVVLTPGFNLDRLTTRLGDRDDAVVRRAMRQLVSRGDERTVKKLYTVAVSDDEALIVRLRAVDAMSLIERVPEVDRALLRLELSGETPGQVREAAMAARKQREAYRARRESGQ